MYQINWRLTAGLLLVSATAWGSVPPATGQGGGSKDANYQLTAGSFTGPAFVVTTVASGWGSQTGAQWIGPAADASNFHSTGQFGNFTFTLNFTVVDITKANLAMSVLNDPDVDIQVNGQFLPHINKSPGSSTMIALNSGSGLVKGANNIAFNVSDLGDGGPVGLNVVFTGTLGDATTAPPTSNTGRGGYSLQSLSEPVDSGSGQYYDTIKDLDLGGPLKLGFSRYYSSALSGTGAASALGTNWMSNFDSFAAVTGTTAKVLQFGGKLVTFQNSGGTWQLQSPLDTVYQFAQAGTGYQMLDPVSRLIYSYSSTGALTAIKDRNGNTITVTPGPNGPTSVTDGLGRTLTFTYTGTQLTKVADESGRSYSYAYNGALLQTVTDDTTHKTSYAYTASGGLLVSKQLPLGNKPTTQAYDSTGRVTSQTDGNGNVTKLAYDGNGTSTITDPAGNVTKQTSDNSGNFTKGVDPAGGVGNATNDSSQRRTTATDRSGKSVSYIYHSGTGYVASATDKLGNTTTYSYTAQTQPPFTFYNLSGVTYPDGTSESYTYDASGNVLSFTARDGSVTKSTYDSTGHITTKTDPANATATYTWNSDGTIAASMDAVGNKTTYSYDAVKRVNKITDPNGGVSSYTYGIAGDTSRTYTAQTPGSGPSTLTKDFNGYPQAAVNATGGATRKTYTATNKIATSTDPVGNKTVYTYDTDDRLASITDGSGVTYSYTYDSNSRVKTVSSGAGLLTAYTYTPDGRIATRTDRAGNQLANTYDAAGHLATFTTRTGNKYTLTYDKRGNLLSRTDPLGGVQSRVLDKVGNVTQITAPGGISTSIARDFQGRPTSITSANGNPWTVAYDAAGRRSKLTDPLGNASSYTYTGTQLTQMTLPLGTLAISRDGDDRVTKRQYSDGTAINSSYDSRGLLTSADNVSLKRDAKGQITNSNGIAITLDGLGRAATLTYATGKVVTYTYNLGGKLASIADWVGGKTSFTYDPAGRIASIAYPSGLTTAFTYNADGQSTKIVYGSLGSITLTRDGIGDITSADRVLAQAPVVTNTKSQQFSYDVAGQLTAATSDKMGRVASQSGRTYNWNLASQLTSFNDAANAQSFTYDGLGSVNTMTTGSTTRTFVFNYLFPYPALSIVRQGGNDLRYYVYLQDGKLLYSIEADGTRRFYHFDEMGNTVMLSNDSGALTDGYAMTPYGEITDHVGSTDNPFTWQGHYGVFQEGTALFNVRARHYDASAARFVSRDALISVDPRGSEPYAYAKGNPLRWVDPFGNDPNNPDDLANYSLYLQEATGFYAAASALSQLDDPFGVLAIIVASDMAIAEELETIADGFLYQPPVDVTPPPDYGGLSLSLAGQFQPAQAASCPTPDDANAISVPLRLDPSGRLIDDVGNVVSNDGGSLIGHDGASFASAGQTIKLEDGSDYLIGHDGASLIGHDGASIASIPAALIGHDGASITSILQLIGHDGASLIGHDGASLIGSDSAGLISANSGK